MDGLILTSSVDAEEGDHGELYTYLNYYQAKSLFGDLYYALEAMDMARAKWMLADEGGLHVTTIHLMKKGAHWELGKALCGCTPPKHKPNGWQLLPMIEEFFHEDSSTWKRVCKHCLRTYQAVERGERVL
jgi:hypothetical protein